MHDYQESTERQYSSSDPYTRLIYSDLSKELKLMNEHKCLAFVSQLLLLLGRVSSRYCDADIATTSVGTNWICSQTHESVQLQLITSTFANNNNVNSAVTRMYVCVLSLQRSLVLITNLCCWICHRPYCPLVNFIFRTGVSAVSMIFYICWPRSHCT